MNYLLERWVKVMEVMVLEAIGQEVAFCHAIPWPPWWPRNNAAAGGEEGEEDLFDMVLYASRGKIPSTMPCAMDTKGARTRRRGKKKPQSWLGAAQGACKFTTW